MQLDRWRLAKSRQKLWCDLKHRGQDLCEKSRWPKFRKYSIEAEATEDQTNENLLQTCSITGRGSESSLAACFEAVAAVLLKRLVNWLWHAFRRGRQRKRNFYAQLIMPPRTVDYLFVSTALIRSIYCTYKKWLCKISIRQEKCLPNSILLTRWLCRIIPGCTIKLVSSVSHNSCL